MTSIRVSADASILETILRIRKEEDQFSEHEWTVIEGPPTAWAVMPQSMATPSDGYDTLATLCSAFPPRESILLWLI